MLSGAFTQVSKDLEALIGGPNALLNQSAEQRTGGQALGQPPAKPEKAQEKPGATKPREPIDDDLFIPRAANVLAQMTAAAGTFGTNPLASLPPHVIALKNILAGSVKGTDLVEQAFSPENLPKTIDEINEERIVNIRRMMLGVATALAATSGATSVHHAALMEMSEQALAGVPIDQLAAGAKAKSPTGTPDEASLGGVVGAFGQPPTAPDEGSFGGTLEGQPSRIPHRGRGEVGVGSIKAMGAALQDGQGDDGQVGTDFRAFEDRPDLDPNNVDTWPAHGGSAWYIDPQTGTPKPDPDVVNRVVRQLDTARLDAVLANIDMLISKRPELKIAPVQNPSTELLIATLLVGLFSPQFAANIGAAPFRGVLAERDRQQAINNAIFQGENQQFGAELGALRDRAQGERIVASENLRGQIAADSAVAKGITDRWERDLKERKISADELNSRRIALTQMFKAISDLGDKNPAAVQNVVAQFNSLMGFGLTQEDQAAIVANSVIDTGLRRQGEVVDIQKGLADIAKTWSNIAIDEKMAALELIAKQEEIDTSKLDREQLKKEISYMDADKAYEWLKEQATIANTYSQIQRREDLSVFDKQKILMDAISAYTDGAGDLLKFHQDVTKRFIARRTELTEELEQARQDQKDLFKDAGDPAYDALTETISGLMTEQTTVSAEITGRERAERFMSTSIGRENNRHRALRQQVTNTNLATGEAIKLGSNAGTYKIGPWSVNMDGFCAIGVNEGPGKGTDCGGLIQQAVASAGIPDFPSLGTAKQQEYMQQRLWTPVNPDGQWIDVLAMPEDSRTLQPGDIAFIVSPGSPSNRHAMIFSHFDIATEKPVWVAAWSKSRKRQDQISADFNKINNDVHFLGIYRLRASGGP